MKDLLSRADTVIRLIEIRKLIKKSKDGLKETPGKYNNKLKEELDQLLIDIIGVPEEGQHKINEILDKAIKGQIKAETATVAVHEIFLDYQNDSDDNSAGKVRGSNNKNKVSRDKENDKKKKNGRNSKIKDNVVNNSDLQELYNSGYR